MSKITNHGLTRSGTGGFIAVPNVATVGVKGFSTVRPKRRELEYGRQCCTVDATDSFTNVTLSGRYSVGEVRPSALVNNQSQFRTRIAVPSAYRTPLMRCAPFTRRTVVAPAEHLQ